MEYEVREYNQYLGPYAELTVTLKTETKDYCGLPSACPNVGSGTCPTCGVQADRRYHHFQKAEPPLYPVVSRVLFDSLLLTDGLHGPERLADYKVVHRLIPNMPKEEQAPRDFYLPEGSCWMDLAGVDMAGEMAWLTRAFQTELEHLRNLYGDLQVRWGFLQWAN